jgi:CHAT domain-containing protein
MAKGLPRFNFGLWAAIAVALGILLGRVAAIAAPDLAEANPIPNLLRSVPAWRQRQGEDPLDRGRRLYRAGYFADAAEAWEGAAAEAGDRGDRASQALSWSYRSLAYQRLSQWDRARDASDRALSLLANSADREPIFLAQATNTEANLLLATGQPRAALETWERAERLYRQAGDDIGAIGSQIDQAYALQHLGFYRQARDRLEKLNRQLGTLDKGGLKVQALHALGIGLQLVGDLDASREVLERCLAIARQQRDLDEISAIYLSLGNTAVNLEDFDSATFYFAKAETTAQSDLERLDARLNQLDVAVRSRQWHQATALVDPLYHELRQIAPSRAWIYSVLNFTDVGIKLDDRQKNVSLAQINELLAQAVAAARSLRDPRAEAHALVRWGRLYERNQQLEIALRLTRDALQIAQGIVATDIVSQGAWQLGRILRSQGDRKGAIAAYQEAVQALESLRIDLVAIDREVQFSFRDSIEPVYRELVSLLLDGDPSPPRLLEARQLIEALQLAELDNFLREACLDMQPVKIEEIDPEAAVIYPIVLEDRLATIVSSSRHPLRYYDIPIPQTFVNQTVEELLQALSPAYDNLERLRLSKILYNWLVLPARSDGTLEGVKTLVFVLDGALRNVPMAALYDGDNYLVEDYNIAFSQGLQLLPGRPLRKGRLQAIAAGLSEARQGFNSLPAVKSELDRLSEEVPTAVLLDEGFTTASLQRKVNQNSAEVIHLATHGQFSSKLEDTFLLTWDGRLGIDELDRLLAEQSIRGETAIELLVLSACETAVGDDRAALGLAGLALKSGARATLATLWAVRDRSTAIFMSEFYTQLGKPGVSKAQAVRQAQLKLLADPATDDPFFWAPFVLVGNWL